MGNTIATTSLWGDRLDEYDYTDYGVPIHSPVALDGRWIENMADIGDGVTSVTLIDAAGSRLAPISLLGCEVRVARRDPSSLIPVFATGWVISQFGTTLKIRDPGHLVADAWTDSASGTGAAEARGCANIYDLRQGFLTGRIEGATDTTCTVPGPWYGEDCTYIDVAAAPFDAWMFTPSPSYLWPVEVVLGDGAARTTAKVIDVANPVANVGFQTLIVAGHHQTAQGAPGKWYWISGIGAERDACQSGEWDAAADQDSSGNFTEFTLPSEAYVSDFQVGWLLQPDINVAVYLPITSISGHSLTVSGSYGSLAPSSSGTHFRIYAPPGVERTGPFYSGFEAGTLSRFTSASSSRNLFGGYRYESPLAGVRDDLWMAVQGRQSGKNFTGLHYTLHRHYDPHLMRFTSTDPAAAPFFNLYAYCQGNPARAYDPDGLAATSIALGLLGDWGRLQRGAEKWLDDFQSDPGGTIEKVKAGFAEGDMRWVRGLIDYWTNASGIDRESFTFGGGIESTEWIQSRVDGKREEFDRRYAAPVRRYVAVAERHGVAVATEDLAGLGGLREGIYREDLATGEPLSMEEASARFKASANTGSLEVVSTSFALKGTPPTGRQPKFRLARQTTVLGHYPEYVEWGRRLRANTFQVPAETWNKLSPAQRTALNRRFLDQAIARGDKIMLATPCTKVRPGSAFAWELEYLSEHGYTLSENGTEMLPPGR